MPAIAWTKTPVDTANTNRDGSGTLVELYEIMADDGEFIDTVVCQPLGTNVATAAVLILSNGQGVANSRNNTILGRASLQATTLGSPAAGDEVTFQIGAWIPKGYVIYALVHDAQAAGRQFTIFSDSTYQRY